MRTKGNDLVNETANNMKKNTSRHYNQLGTHCNSRDVQAIDEGILHRTILQ